MDSTVVQEFDFSEYMAASSTNPGHHSHGPEEAELDLFADFQQASSSTSPSIVMNLDTPEGMVNPFSSTQSQGQDQQQNRSQTNQLQQHLLQQAADRQQNPNVITAEMLELKGRLEQQMKLQQLQQFILQQQIELLSGSSQASAAQLMQQNTPSQQRDAIFGGLLTPGPSGEIPAMIPKDLVSPMMGMYLNSPSGSLPSQPSIQQINPSFSAPAALAFPNTNFPLPNHDFSPLISPMIHPHGTDNGNAEMNASLLQMHASNQTAQPMAHHNMGSESSSRPRLKRTGSVDDHDQPARKRSLHATPSSSVSTPGFSASGSYIVPSNDSPSPVDLSMPPPVSANNVRSENDPVSSGSAHVSIAPMTPATMLNLRGRSAGLEPSVPSNYSSDPKDGMPAKRASKGKAPAVTISPSSGSSRGRRGSVATKTAFSPSLKPLLPGAQPPTPTSPLALPANAPPRKSSHKVAEQKRRDSLKTSFDELRLLLPPVALPEDEELLPGCMPPRGPPKGDADGPNRGVSKLALLRCGNAYIKELKGMVKRRDVEIQNLRVELKRLGSLVSVTEAEQRQLHIDLERDVDEGRSVEAGIRLTMRSHNAGNGGSDEQDEDG